MNVNNGEIISIVSLPDFNPNQRNAITDVNYINRTTKGVYELGSVFKTFTLAAAINERTVEPETEFKNLKKSIRCGKNINRGIEIDSEVADGPNSVILDQVSAGISIRMAIMSLILKN